MLMSRSWMKASAAGFLSRTGMDRVVGALTTGEFSWGTFMRTLGDYSAFASTNTIAGHDVPTMIGKMAQIELSHGGKTWAQLYAAMALHSPGWLTHGRSGIQD